MNVRSLLSCLALREAGGLFSLNSVFSRLKGPVAEFAVYVELEKPPFLRGIGINLRLTQRGQEVWTLGEELIELVPGENLVVFAARLSLDAPILGACRLECVVDGVTAAARMLYFGSRRRRK